MPQKKFSKKELQDSDLMRSYAKSKNERTIAGVKVKNTTSTDAKMLITVEMLQKNGYLADNNSAMSLDEMADSALGSIGCSLLTGDDNRTKGHSLLNSMKKQIPSNPNIIDPLRVASLENEKTSGHDKFNSPDDPFYILDEKKSTAQQAERALVDGSNSSMLSGKGPDLISKFYDLNILNKRTYTLKQFTS